MINYKNDVRFLFWQQWLFYSSLILALAGLVLAVFGFLSGFYQAKIAVDLFGKAELSEESLRILKFIKGPYGATIACCYLLLAFVARYAFRRREKWARDAIVVAFGVWFIFDSAVCIANHVYFQLIYVNLISFFQKALPLAFTWTYFTED